MKLDGFYSNQNMNFYFGLQFSFRVATMVCVCLFQIYLTSPITLLIQTIEPQKGVNFCVFMYVCAHLCMHARIGQFNQQETLLLDDALKAHAVKGFPFTSNIKVML